MAKITCSSFKIGHNSYDGWHNFPNLAGGVSVQMNITNHTGKEIKYITFRFLPKNAVGDVQMCSIKHVAEYGGQLTGPIAPGMTEFSIIWENMWYNSTITKVELLRAYIEYMDGTEEMLDASEIEITYSSGGCYVATAVYGSYDCPEVWTLRRYRDYTLAESWYGRVFIKTYYAISPTLIKWFGHTEWFKNMWKGKLDRMVKKLQDQGVESTPYTDTNW